LWCIHSTIELERRGLATTTICSSNFTSVAESTAKAKGSPGIGLVSIPHPIAKKDNQIIRRTADDAIEELTRVLTGSVEKLCGEAEGKTGTGKGAA
jgi:hypothetical protein